MHETCNLTLSSTAAQPTANIGGAVGCCQRCAPHAEIPQTQLRCVYCTEPVDVLYPPCLNCGCAFHEACLAEWHAQGQKNVRGR